MKPLNAVLAALVLAPCALADVPIDEFADPFTFFLGPFDPPAYQTQPIAVGADTTAVRAVGLGAPAGISVSGTDATVYGSCHLGYWGGLAVGVPTSGTGSLSLGDVVPFGPLLDLSAATSIEVECTVPTGTIALSFSLTIFDATLTTFDNVFVPALPNGTFTVIVDPATDFAGAVDLSAIGGISLSVFTSGPGVMTLHRFEAIGAGVPSFPSFCDAADGSLASCPCANPGNPDSGCDIQQLTGGVKLDVVAQETSPSNGVTMTGTGFPAGSTPASIVIRAPSLEAAPVPFGDGLRCIGTPLVRLAATFAAGGSATHTFGHGAMAGTGDFHYQLWFRNTPAMYCTPDAFNLSNGRIATW